jgi:hypothetical protein
MNPWFPRELPPYGSENRREAGQERGLAQPARACGNAPILFVFEPKWRNWQTRRTQNPVGREARVGSIPTFGICRPTAPRCPCVSKGVKQGLSANGDCPTNGRCDTSLRGGPCQATYENSNRRRPRTSA